MAKRDPNGRLRTLLIEARWSGQDFARAVNGIAAEAGLTLSYDRTSVSHWLAGTRPPAHVVDLAAEALSRRTGRRIAAADTGLARPAGTRARERPGGGAHDADVLAAAALAGAQLPDCGPDFGVGALGEIPVYSSAWRPRRSSSRTNRGRPARGPGYGSGRTTYGPPRRCSRSSATPT